MSRYFLVAMMATILSCGGGGNTTPESDTNVSEDSTLGDSMEKCKKYEWMDKMKFYCEGFVDPDCEMEIAPHECGLSFGADLWIPIDQLDIYPPPNVKIIMHIGSTFYTCTPTSQ